VLYNLYMFTFVIERYLDCYVDFNFFSGHNSDGKMLERAGKITFKCENSPRLISKYVEKNKGQASPVGPITIKDVKCGVNHAVAMDDKGRVFTWGFAGLYFFTQNKTEFFKSKNSLI
jgi:alpha-tubulin suppressor-like RCC1 family protein